MSAKATVKISMGHTLRVLLVWWVALAVGGAAAAVVGPAQELFAAAIRGDAAAVKALLDAGAEVNAQTSSGTTALMVASQNGHRDVVQALLAKGAKVNAQTSNGRTALDEAMAQKHTDVIALLVQAGNRTPEHSAARATVPQPSKLAPLVYEGRRLTAEQAGALEEQLKTNPEDLAARTRLLGYYFTIAKNQIGVPATIAARRRHILWLIEHHPESEVTGLSESTLDVLGHDLADKEGFEQARALWVKQLELHKDSAEVMTNAAMFFKLPDKALAVQAAERAHEIEPANSERTAQMGFTYAVTILGVNQMSNTGIPVAVDLAEEQSPLAQSVIAKLDKSQDAALLDVTGGLIAQDGMMVTRLRGMSPSDLKVDYQALSERYLQRAADLDPAKYSFDLGHMYSMRADANQTATPEQRTALKKKALALELASLERYPDARPMTMNEVCRVALEVSDVGKAQSCAERMLANAEALKDEQPSSKGDALNKAHNFMGRVALHKGDLEKAKQELLAAGNVPGDGTLTSLGPNMALAKELLEKGEREVVLQYLDLCGKFWPYGSRQLAAWKLAVQNGNMPQFGANLIY
jgi:hypothetical protein